MTLEKAVLDVIRAWDSFAIQPNSDAGLLAMANLRQAIALIKDHNELGDVHVSTSRSEPSEGIGICVR